MEFRKAIGKRIKIARIESDRSQEWLAEFFNVSPKTISAWEAGRNAIESARLGEIAFALGKPVAYFFEPFEQNNQGAGAHGKQSHPPVLKKERGGNRKAA